MDLKLSAIRSNSCNCEEPKEASISSLFSGPFTSWSREHVVCRCTTTWFPQVVNNSQLTPPLVIFVHIYVYPIPLLSIFSFIFVCSLSLGPSFSTFLYCSSSIFFRVLAQCCCSSLYTDGEKYSGCHALEKKNLLDHQNMQRPIHSNRFNKNAITSVISFDAARKKSLNPTKHRTTNFISFAAFSYSPKLSQCRLRFC